MHLNQESQNTRGFYHLKSTTGNIWNGQRKEKSIRWQLYLVCGSSLPEGPCWRSGVHSMSWCYPWSLSLCCPAERTAGNRFPVLEQQNWWDQACTPTPCFNLLPVECQTPKLDQHAQRCSAGFTQQTADCRKHFISGLCGWFQPSSSWWQRAVLREMSLHSFI